MDVVLVPPTAKRTLTGKALLATALTEQGYSRRKTAKLSGLSVPTVQKLAHQNIVPASDVEPVKRSLRNRMALLADAAVNGINPEKIKGASALELARIADLAMKNAGLAPPQVTETYTAHVMKYVKSTSSSDELKTPKTTVILKTEDGK